MPDSSMTAPLPAGSPTTPLSTPVAGTLWAGSVDIHGQEPDSGGTSTWTGHLHDTKDPVIVRAGKVNDEARNSAWETMLGLTHPGLLRCIERHQVGQRWFEVYSAPRGLPLSRWLAAAHPVGEARITAFFKELAPALASLHEAGLVHLNLHPDTVFIAEDKDGLDVHIGGLELVTEQQQKDLITIPVDPFYAPPEAAGLYRHVPGPDLVAWDWWSAGRLVQELCLGRHVLGLLLDRDLSRLTPELKDKADQLARERLPGSVRAGAVENMPGLPPRLSLLLKGLLAGSRDARWRAPEAAQWNEGESPLEHYNLPSKEHCFRYQNQAYTVPEAAALFRDETHWDAAVGHLFNAEQPGSLSAFIHSSTPPALQQKLDLVTHLLSDEWVLGFPKLARDEVLTALALQQLAGGRLLWRGRHMDAATLQTMLQHEDGKGEWLACVRLFCSPPILGILDKTDAETERNLSEIGRHAGKAIEAAHSHHWLPQNSPLDELRLWELAVDHAFLQKALHDLRARYACSTRADVQAYFKLEHPAEDVKILLCYLAAHPDTYGLITHEEWARRRYQELYAEGLDISETLCWKRLRLALGSGPWWFGRIWWMIAGWGGFALVFACLKPGPLWFILGLVPALLALVVRWSMLGSLNPILAIHFPQTSPWRFMDGPGRCTRETEAKKHKLRSIGELNALLLLHNEDIAKLSALQPPPPQIIVPPKFTGLRLSAYASWLILASLVAFCFYQAKVNPPSLLSIKLAWHVQDTQPQEPAEEVHHNQKIPWPYKAPVEMRVATPVDQHPATEQELALARERGAALLSKFETETITDPVLIPLPTDKYFAFALYDGKKNGLAIKSIIRLSYQPMPRTWLMIEGKKVYVHVE